MYTSELRSCVSESRGGPPEPLVLKKPRGFCGRTATLNRTVYTRAKKIAYAHWKSCSPCQSMVDYRNTKITQHTLKTAVEAGHNRKEEELMLHVHMHVSDCAWSGTTTELYNYIYGRRTEGNWFLRQLSQLWRLYKGETHFIITTITAENIYKLKLVQKKKKEVKSGYSKTRSKNMII